MSYILVFLITLTEAWNPKVTVQKALSWKMADGIITTCEMRANCYPLAIEIQKDGNIIVYNRVSKRQWERQNQ
jgi:hypothetical protein